MRGVNKKMTVRYVSFDTSERGSTFFTTKYTRNKHLKATQTQATPSKPLCDPGITIFARMENIPGSFFFFNEMFSVCLRKIFIVEQ